MKNITVNGKEFNVAETKEELIKQLGVENKMNDPLMVEAIDKEFMWNQNILNNLNDEKELAFLLGIED